jgi:PPM family protein phosphatase
MVKAAGFSDIGKVRRTNEDTYLLNEPTGLYIVADGMGGHRGGEVASRMAVETIDTVIAKFFSQTAGNGNGKVADSTLNFVNQLRQSIYLANQKIYTQSITDADCRGMGTTVSALYLAGDSIIAANVGDSPIYLLRNGEIENLYTPHTLLHEYKKIPKSLEGRFSEGKLAHILTRAVGIRSEVDVDIVETPCFAGDTIVLCSDGLSGKLSREEIRDTVCRNDAQAACRKMSALALERGGEDNITVVVVRVTAAADASSKSLVRRLAGISAWITSRFVSRGRS